MSPLPTMTVTSGGRERRRFGSFVRLSSAIVDSSLGKDW